MCMCVCVMHYALVSECANTHFSNPPARVCACVCVCTDVRAVYTAAVGVAHARARACKPPTQSLLRPHIVDLMNPKARPPIYK